MRKKILALGLAAMVLTSCANTNEETIVEDETSEVVQSEAPTIEDDSEQTGAYEKYEHTFFNTFDTLISYMEYNQSEEDFKENADFVEAEFNRYHKLFDNYNEYEGVYNIKTVNNAAGQGPVVVDPDLIDLVEFSIKANKEVSPKVNIAMGSVLGLWHEAREEGIENPEAASLPNRADLEEASKHMNIDDIIVDRENSTIEIMDPSLSIDLGATAKGYATERVMEDLKARGVESCILSSGGNVKTLGQPMDGRDAWGVGIQNPENAFGRSEDQILDVILLDKSASVVTSGNYQRYYEVDGEIYHHIVDPDVLEPVNYYTSVSILIEDSAMADFLSTAAYLLPLEESKALVEKMGAEGLWVLEDGSIEYTAGMAGYLESQSN